MNKLIDKKGMTSILVLVFMTVILLLGISTVIASLSNQKLANKKEAWQIEYYQLEAHVSKILSALDEDIRRLSNMSGFEEAFINKYPQAYEENDDLYYEFQVVNEEEDRGISVKVKVPLIENSQYEIFEYYEFARPFEYNQDTKFEDPF